MAALVFPDITPPMTPEVLPENVALATRPEDGPVMTRARFTRSRKTFFLNWGPDKNLLPTDDMETFLSFYEDSTKGGAEAFDWECKSKFSPFHGQTFSVRFIGEAPQFRMEAPGYWSTRAIIQEV